MRPHLRESPNPGSEPVENPHRPRHEQPATTERIREGSVRKRDTKILANLPGDQCFLRPFRSIVPTDLRNHQTSASFIPGRWSGAR